MHRPVRWTRFDDAIPAPSAMHICSLERRAVKRPGRGQPHGAPVGISPPPCGQAERPSENIRPTRPNHPRVVGAPGPAGWQNSRSTPVMALYRLVPSTPLCCNAIRRQHRRHPAWRGYDVGRHREKGCHDASQHHWPNGRISAMTTRRRICESRAWTMQAGALSITTTVAPSFSVHRSGQAERCTGTAPNWTR
jgi:hypothetical protein